MSQLRKQRNWLDRNAKESRLQQKHLVVSHTSKYVFFSCMPIYVLFDELISNLLANVKDGTNPDNRVMSLENSCWLDGASALCIGVYIPGEYQ